MASVNAEAVAKDVLQKVRNGQKVKLGEIILENGYSEVVSESPTKVTKTKSYQKVMQPFVEQMEKERQRLMSEISIRDLSSEDYKTMVEAIDKLTKNIQLMSGGVTERRAIVLPQDISEKYGE